MIGRAVVVGGCGLARLAFALAIVLAAACGAGGLEPAPAPGQPLVTVASDGGNWVVSIVTSPQPPRKGTVDVTYQINASDAPGAPGAPADGLTLNVVPWMPAHGHGASELPIVTALGGGAYLASPVYLYMAGHWELRTEIVGDVTDTVAPAFDVP